MEIKVSKAKFTKGEWVVKGSSMAMGDIYRGDFSVKSNCFSGNISDASNANASLIAAAPDMYEMLTKFLPMDEDGNGLDFQYNEGSEWMGEEVVKLLAKARGE